MVSDPTKSNGEGPKKPRPRRTTQSQSKTKRKIRDSMVETVTTESGEGIKVLFRDLKEGESSVDLSNHNVSVVKVRGDRKPVDTKKRSTSRSKTKTTPKKEDHVKKSSLSKQNVERIPVPEGAPRVAIVNGRSCLYIDGEVVPPFFFFGNPRNEKACEVVLNEIRRAGAAGVHVHCLMIDFRVDEEGAQDALDLSVYLLKEVVEADPKAKVLFRIVFAGGESWDQKYPESVYRHEDGTLAEPSFFDDSFWSDAKKYLRGYIKALRDHPNHNCVIGLHLDRGEWFFAEGWGYDSSQAGLKKFREWVRARYNDDRVLLQSSWFDGSVRFDTVQIPDYKAYPLLGDAFLRARRKDRRWVDYHLFLSDAIVERIQELAYEVKSASSGWFLVGVNYGYTFEWAHAASGHLSLGKLLRTPNVDIIKGPPSYRDRKLGDAAPFPCPIDSFPLNGKLFVSEEDYKTPMGNISEPDEFNPVMETPQALEAAHWRGVGCALAHGSGIEWMDLWGNGWLNTPKIWERAVMVYQSLARSLTTPLRDPDVAVLIDERSLAYLSDTKAFKQLVQGAREAVMRAGVSAGFYLLTDLAHRTRFPDAKLYIFLNAWDIRPEVRSAIKRRLQVNGKTLFWVYCAGLLESGRYALERVREVTGIAIRPQPFSSSAGTTLLNRKHPLTELLEERALSVVEQLEPSYFAIPEEDTTVLGIYNQTGLPSFVIREVESGNPNDSWRSVFLGEPLVTEKLIRGLCTLCGIPVWNFNGDAVHVRPPFLTIHYSGTGHRIAVLPDKWHAYDVLQNKMVGEDLNFLQRDATDGATEVLIVGEEAEVQQIAAIQHDMLHTLSPEFDFIDDSEEPEDLVFELNVPLMFVEAEALENVSKDEVLATDSESSIVKQISKSRKKPVSSKLKPINKKKSDEKYKADLGINVVFRGKE